MDNVLKFAQYYWKSLGINQDDSIKDKFLFRTNLSSNYNLKDCVYKGKMVDEKPHGKG